VLYLVFGGRYHSGIISLEINVAYAIEYIFLLWNPVLFAEGKVWIK